MGFAAGLLMASLATAIAEAEAHYRRGAPLPVAVIGADVGGLWVGLVAASLWASRRHGRGSLRGDFGLRFRWRSDLLVGVAVGLACQFALLPLLYLPLEALDPALRHQLGRPAEQDIGAAHGAVAVAALLLLLAVGAPLVEELFFRGLLLRGLLGRLPAPLAILLSGVLFGLAHFEAVQLLGLAVFGIVLGTLAWRTGRLGPSVAAHAAFNAAAVVSVVHLH